MSLRLGPIASGLPYLNYIDEGHILHHVTQILQEGKLDTGFYNYPSLPSYLIAAAALAYAPAYRLIHGHSLWTDLADGDAQPSHARDYYDFIFPTEIILLGRAVVLFLSVATVILAGHLARLIGGKRAGLLALLLTALCPALVSRGAIVIVDTVATFFALLTLYFCQQLQARADSENSRASWNLAVCAGLASGFSFASKYTVGAVFVAVLVTILMSSGTTRIKVQLSLASGLGLVAGSIFAMPAIVLHPAKIAATVLGIARFYHEISSEVGYLAAAMAPEELGLPLLAVGTAGIIFMLLRNHRSRAVALGWCAFGAILVGALIGARFQPLRNLLPLVPLICIAAACFLARVHFCFANEHLRRLTNRVLAPGLSLLVATSLALPAWRYFQERHTLIDSRTAAINWLQKHARPTDRILAFEELAIHPSEWRRVAAQRVVLPWVAASETIPDEAFTYILTSDFNLRFASDVKRSSEQRERWRGKLSGMRPKIAFGQIPCDLFPGVWRTNDERIVIYRADKPPLP